MAALEDELAAQRVELNAKEEEHIEERRTLDDEIAALDGTHQFTKSKVREKESERDREREREGLSVCECVSV